MIKKHEQPVLRQYSKHWLTLSEVEEDYEGPNESSVKDQLLNNCPNDLRIFLKQPSFEKCFQWLNLLITLDLSIEALEVVTPFRLKLELTIHITLRLVF